MANDHEVLTQESEISKMLDRFGEQDKRRAAHVAELLDQARKLAQGFCAESSNRARSFARLLASAKAARNSAPRQRRRTP